MERDNNFYYLNANRIQRLPAGDAGQFAQFLKTLMSEREGKLQ
jgi:hypothetical protein